MKILNIILIIVFASFNLLGQIVNAPESIVFDEISSSYLISNTGNGTIIKMEENGTLHDFASGLFQPRGILLKDGKLFVAEGNRISGYDVNSGNNIFNIDIPAAAFLNDICGDNNGFLYTSATINNKIYKISISNSNYSIFVDSNLDSPNGLHFDAANNRIILVSFAASMPIQAINMADSSVSSLFIPSLNYLDGICVDHNGNYYISTWINEFGTGNGKILKYDANFSQETILVDGFAGPADISFNIHKMEIAVPNMIGNSILFVDLCNVNTGEISGDTIVYENTAITYSIENTPSSTYSWLISGGAIEAGMNSNSVDVLWGTSGTGKISVQETDQYNCQGEIVQIEVTIKAPSHVEILNPFKLNLYPNPASDFFAINYSLQNTKNVDISILDKNGNFVSSITDGKQNVGEYNLRLNCKSIGISSGIYFIKFLIDEQIFIKKIVII